MSFPELKHTLFLDVLNGKTVERPPVWMMRQAGRYLPEYREIQAKHDFFTRVKTPELACEITLQPIDIVGTDAAIIFSDILVILECLSIEVQLKPGFGPLIPEPIRTVQDLDRIKVIPAEDQLTYMYDALSLTRKELGGRVPLIGFAGAPWTLFCYLVEGQGSKTFSTAKSFLFSQPEASNKILSTITDLTIAYLHKQVEAGAQALQVFESWAASLGPDDFVNFALPHLRRISAEDYGVPLIMFCKDAEWSYPLFDDTLVKGFGIGWGCTPEDARSITEGKVAQGNFDPSKLLATPQQIEAETKDMLNRFGPQNHIANLGHGILPNVPVENAQAFVNTVKNYSY